MTAGSADLTIAFHVSGDLGGSPTSISGDLSGPYGFSNKIGSLPITLQGSSTVNALLGAGTHPLILANGIAYIHPSPASQLAGALGGKQYGSIAIGSLFSELMPSAGPLASVIASNPGEALELFDTSAAQVTTVGSSSVGGAAATEYHVVVNVAQAASAGGPAAALYQQMKSASSTISTVAANIWVNGAGNLVQLQISGSIPPASGSTTPTDFAITLDASGFGTPVNVAVPPASEVAQL